MTKRTNADCWGSETSSGTGIRSALPALLFSPLPIIFWPEQRDRAGEAEHQVHQAQGLLLAPGAGGICYCCGQRQHCRGVCFSRVGVVGLESSDNTFYHLRRFFFGHIVTNRHADEFMLSFQPWL